MRLLHDMDLSSPSPEAFHTNWKVVFFSLLFLFWQRVSVSPYTSRLLWHCNLTRSGREGVTGSSCSCGSVHVHCGTCSQEEMVAYGGGCSGWKQVAVAGQVTHPQPQDRLLAHVELSSCERGIRRCVYRGVQPSLRNRLLSVSRACLG